MLPPLRPYMITRGIERDTHTYRIQNRPTSLPYPTQPIPLLTLLGGPPPEIADREGPRYAGEGADSEIAEEAVLEAPVDGERGPGGVAEEGLAPL